MKKGVFVGVGLLGFFAISIGAWLFFSYDSSDVVVEKQVNLVGVWESTDDPRAVNIYSTDGSVRELYDGKEMQKGTWVVVDKVLDGPDPSLGVLQTVFEGENYVYTILEATDSVLVVSYQQRGNILTYIRRNALPQSSDAVGFSINKAGTAAKVGKGTGRPDLTALVLGDQKYSDTPKVGYIYSCQSSFNGAGASVVGEWIDEEGGTYDVTSKPTVDGLNVWPEAFITIDISADTRVITANGVPTTHGTGDFPIDSTDDAYVYDRNPNTVSEQTVSLTFPLTPEVAKNAGCLPMGVIGVALNGVSIFNGYDALGRDAVAYEIQDSCDGHPERTGAYHYHSGSQCFEDELDAQQHSSLFGYALDGFGLYGKKSGGAYVNNNDLDECHGHTHEVMWDGGEVSMYHYHVTDEYPYTLGCFKGVVSGAITGDQHSSQGAPPPEKDVPRGAPPQEALTACAEKKEQESCSITTMQGERDGVCRTVPNSDSLACVPH